MITLAAIVVFCVTMTVSQQHQPSFQYPAYYSNYYQNQQAYPYSYNPYGMSSYYHQQQDPFNYYQPYRAPYVSPYGNRFKNHPFAGIRSSAPFPSPLDGGFYNHQQQQQRPFEIIPASYFRPESSQQSDDGSECQAEYSLEDKAKINTESN